MQDTSWVVKMEKDIGQFMIANYLPSSKESFIILLYDHYTLE